MALCSNTAATVESTPPDNPSTTLSFNIVFFKLFTVSFTNVEGVQSCLQPAILTKKLCKICFPAYIQSFILSDVIGDDLSSIASGMTTYDETTFSDVQNILKKYICMGLNWYL